MKKYIIFIQSVSASEWEVGEILQWEIDHNPNYKDCVSKVLYVKNQTELLNVFASIMNTIEDDVFVIVQIDAHSNPQVLEFKDKNPQQAMRNPQTAIWATFTDSFDALYKKFGERILLIFISCYSASFFAKLQSPHVPVIAAEGLVAARRAEEQLLAFYDVFCTGKSIEESYKKMVEKFPPEEEINRKEEQRAILKLFR